MPNPKAKWHPSTNFTIHKEPRLITCIVLHATATPSLGSPLAWLRDAKSNVSAHYLIDTNGDLYQLVEENNMAWHAGISVWDGLPHVNSFSIGIELVNSNDGKMGYSVAQLSSTLALCKDICNERNITPANVVAHADVAPGRKNDPLDFPWVDFRASLIKELYS